MKRKNLVSVLLIVTPVLIGISSTLLTMDMMDKYGSITKPFLSPPSILFPIVWTVLYLLMGVASAIIYCRESSQYRSIGLTLHITQLVLNFFWSIIFFNLGKYAFAFIWLVILWLVVFSMLLNFKNVSKTAFFLNIPYIVWLTFAAYLNLAVAVLN